MSEREETNENTPQIAFIVRGSPYGVFDELEKRATDAGISTHTPKLNRQTEIRNEAFSDLNAVIPYVLYLTGPIVADVYNWLKSSIPLLYSAFYTDRDFFTLKKVSARSVQSTGKIAFSIKTKDKDIWFDADLSSEEFANSVLRFLKDC